MKHHETVGGHLVASVLRARPEESARGILARLAAEKPASLELVLATDAHGHLLGAVPLARVLALDAHETLDESAAFGLKVMLLLAIATSIDALAAGFALPLMGAPLGVSLLTIGVTTASLSALGLFAGHRFGAALGSRLDALGGIVLIGLGLKTLIEHLSAG